MSDASREARLNTRVGTYASIAAIIAALVTFAATYVFATKSEVNGLRTEQVKHTGTVTAEMVKVQGDMEAVRVKVDIIHREQIELRRSVDRLNTTISEKISH
jgi:hypothetical protein